MDRERRIQDRTRGEVPSFEFQAVPHSKGWRGQEAGSRHQGPKGPGENRKTIQAEVSTTHPGFTLMPGDCTEIMNGQDHDASRPGWVLVRRGPKDQTGRLSGREPTNLPTWAAWMPEVIQVAEQASSPGDATFAPSSGCEDMGCIFVTTHGGEFITPAKRAEGWVQGLQRIEENGRLPGVDGRCRLKGATIYIELGSSLREMGDKAYAGKGWWKHYAAPVAAFGRRIWEEHGARVVMTRVRPQAVTHWDEKRVDEWTHSEKNWYPTLEILRKHNPLAQSEQTERGSLVQVLKKVSTEGADLFHLIGGVACPSREDGVYAAEEGLRCETRLNQVVFDTGDDGGIRADQTGAGYAGGDHEYGSGTVKGLPGEGGGRVGAPVAFAQDDADHQDMRERRRMNGNCGYLLSVREVGVICT